MSLIGADSWSIWGGINLLEGYGNDNPGAKSQGMKQLMAGAGVAVVGTDARSAALRAFCLSVVKKKITGTLPRTHAAALAPKEGDPL